MALAFTLSAPVALADPAGKTTIDETIKSASGSGFVGLEGGPTGAAALMAGGVVDEFIGYVGPVLLGRGRPSVSDLGITTMDHALRLRPTDITLIGNDVRITAALKETA